ncbi:MAG: tetratricopeptide repeat protein [Acidobacteriota bacterium]|nr:tetratricopeptide repeat protein [Acidobacteriota bacterium]
MRAISFLIAAMLCAESGDAFSNALNEYRLGHLKAAERYAQEAMKQSAHNAEAQVLLALVRAGQGDCLRQRTALGSAWRSNGFPELRRLAGLAAVQCAIAQEKPEGGITILEELKQAYPQDADVLYLGAKLYMKGWNTQVADMFAKAPASYRVNQLSGEIFEMQGHFSEAASEYAKAIAKNPQAINLHFRRGRVLLLSSHEPAALEQAQREFEAETALNAEDAAAIYQIGQIREALGDHVNAVKRFEEAESLRPDFPEALLALAKARLRDRRAPEAIALLERTVALQPSNETAHYNLMLAYRTAARPEEAAKEKAILDRLQKPPGGEFSDFLKKLGEKPVQP